MLAPRRLSPGGPVQWRVGFVYRLYDPSPRPRFLSLPGVFMTKLRRLGGGPGLALRGRLLRPGNAARLPGVRAGSAAPGGSATSLVTRPPPAEGLLSRASHSVRAALHRGKRFAFVRFRAFILWRVILKISENKRRLKSF